MGLLIPSGEWKSAGMVREFQLLVPSPWYEGISNVLVQRKACQQVTAFRLLATQLEQGGSWTTPPCLGLLEKRDFLPLGDFRGAWGLLSGAGWRDSGIGQGLPRMCCPFWDASRGALQSHVGNLQVPHLHDLEWWYAWPQRVRCGWERPHGPCLWRESTTADAKGGPTCWCSCL